MTKGNHNKFRSHCGSVQSGNEKPTDSARRSASEYAKDRVPDCAYLLHAGIASTRRHGKDKS